MSESIIDLTQDGGEGDNNSPTINSIQVGKPQNGQESAFLAKENISSSNDLSTMQGSPLLTQASQVSFNIQTNVDRIFLMPAAEESRTKRTRQPTLHFLPLHAYPPEIEYKLAPSQLGPRAKKPKINQCLAAKKEAAANITHDVPYGFDCHRPNSCSNSEFRRQ